MTAIHPEVNGLMEKQKSNATKVLKAFNNDCGDWYDRLDSITFLLRGEQYHFTGNTPYKMMFSWLLTLPLWLKMRPYCDELPEDGKDLLNMFPPSQEDFLACPIDTDKNHNSALRNIFMPLARQAR